jgi:hypothetical protein
MREGATVAGGEPGNYTCMALADEIGIPITVCHYPPGTSKWNRVEHRLFSFISLTWKGQPLWNYETVVNLIGATHTKTGLKVKAILDTNEYETGLEVSKEQMASYRSAHTRHIQTGITLYLQDRC